MPTQAEKAAFRAAKLKRLTEKALPQGRFPVAYLDPPWRFEAYSPVTGMDRAADNHYPTLTVDEIVARPPPLAKDAILFMWATVPMLPQALAVIAAWGLRYKSHMVWVKHKAGTGFWFRNQHELLIVATRGEIPAPLMGTQASSVLMSPAGRHSAKPVEARAMIERLYPGVPKIEMYAREATPGWTAWGNEVEGESA
jgi:N6-adenosine-specific RNA methylase IME4